MGSEPWVFQGTDCASQEVLIEERVMDPLGVLIIVAALCIIGGATAIYGWGALFFSVGVLILLYVYLVSR